MHHLPRHFSRRLALTSLVTLAFFATGHAQAQATTASPSAAVQQALRQDGTIILLRHALAPGTGDPAGFRLGDCRTQRNLDDTGRAQARALGEQLRALKVPVRQVWHSEWCRTRETAELAFPGLAQPQSAFNSFFQERGEADRRTAAALQRLRTWQGPGVLLVVTHMVNIQALTGQGMGSGEGLVVRMEGGTLRVVGPL